MNPQPFTPYEKFIVGLLTFLQFTIVLDFMVLSPLGAILIQSFSLTPAQFGWVVSAYAFSAGISGLLAAGFADRFDRKKLLLFFYVGFILGTLFCALAPNYVALLAARAVTGVFAGVIGSIVLAITADLFPMAQRGRVMGFIQSAFAASQVLGIPLSLFLANNWGWHSPFLLIVSVSSIVGIFIFYYLKPINAHLKKHPDRNPVHHLFHTLTSLNYTEAFLSTALLSAGGFMLMPFASAFSVHNLGISMHELPIVYGATGLCSMVVGPMMGRLSDKIGKYAVFCIGTFLTILMVIIYTHLGMTPIGWVIVVSALLFAGVSSRLISSMALISGVPPLEDRGAFMAVNSSLQQMAGGIATAVAGMIVVQVGDSPLENFDILGYVVCAAAGMNLFLMYRINQQVNK